MAASGAQQFGVGVKAGVEALHKTLCARAELSPGPSVLALEVRNAFTSLDRAVAATNIAATLPVLAPVFQAWYGQSTVHQVGDGTQKRREVRQLGGLDQGCPLSPASFAAAVAPALAQA